MNSYLPGSSVRISTTVTVLGVLTNPSGMELQVCPSGGSYTIYSSPVNDSPGAYHQDILIPSGSPGLWKYRWTASGSAAGVAEGAFLVGTLNF